jgi:tRNA A37 threonylcarbamoyladenosine biosynthesis protein TsaE
VDLYRLETREQILAAGLEEFLRPDGVAVIEWAEKLEELKGPAPAGQIRRVKIETLNENERRITHEDLGG